MFLVPFVLNKEHQDWITISLFVCDVGRSLWTVDESLTDTKLKALLKKNDLITKKILRRGTLCFAEIDTHKTKIDEFYNWDELEYRTGTEDCWRHLQIPKGLIDCVIFRRELWKATGLPLSLELETFFMESTS